MHDSFLLLPLGESQGALYLPMYFIAFYIDSTEGSGRTEVLTGTATDALRLVDHGNIVFFVTFIGHHLNGTRRTMTGTVVTTHIIGQHYTVFLNPHGMTDLLSRLFLTGDRTDGTRRTYLRTARTLGTTIAALVLHHRLHQMLQIVAGTQNLVGTLCNTQLASRTMLEKVSG